MKKLLVFLLALCMILTFTPVFSDNTYSVKGIADGDRFAISASAVNQTQKIYVVDENSDGITPTAATGVDSVDFYVDGTLLGSTSEAPFGYEIPLETGDHALSVVINPSEGDAIDAGTFNYSVLAMQNKDDAVSENFDNGTAGEAVTFGTMTLDADESCTYETAPETGSLAMAFKYNGEEVSGEMNTNSSIALDYVDVPVTNKIVTVDYDFYVANSNQVRIANILRNKYGAVVPEGIYGQLERNYAKDMWHHVSYVFDFDSLSARGYLDGYEIERINGLDLFGAKNVFTTLSITRYNPNAVVYIDNYEFAAKSVIAEVHETPYEVKGIVDGERIPAGLHTFDLNRTISVVDAGVSDRTVTTATNLKKAEFYIDGVLTATVEQSPFRFDLPDVTDFNTHTLSVKTTDVAGREQEFGPYTYDPVNTTVDPASIFEGFEGEEGTAVTAGKLNGIPTLASQNSPVYATVDGSDGTAMKLTMTDGKNTSIQTDATVPVPASGFTTYDLDFYSTSSSPYMKFYLYSRDNDSTALRADNSWEILKELKMVEVAKNTWHHISYVYDSDRLEYCAFIDGYEFDRGAMNENITNSKKVFLRLDTQNFSEGDLYIDNIKVTSLPAANDVTAAFTDNGDGTASIIAINDLGRERDIDVYHSEYLDGEELARYITETYTTQEGEIWYGSEPISTVTVAPEATKTRLFVWGKEDLTPLGAFLEILK